MSSLVAEFLDLFYPSRCPSCFKLTDGDFCPRCARLLPAIELPACGYCGKPTSICVTECRDCRGRLLYFNSARSAWIFSGPAREVIHAFKFSNQRSLAPVLARYLKPLIAPLKETGLAVNTSRTALSDSNILITWVPLTRRKTWSRGYNQAKLLAINLGRETDIRARSLLRRTRETTDQNQLSGQLRRSNLKGAFEVTDCKRIAGSDIILVDDVYTTGSTVAECAKTLAKAGAASVRVVTLARTVMK